MKRFVNSVKNKINETLDKIRKNRRILFCFIGIHSWQATKNEIWDSNNKIYPIEEAERVCYRCKKHQYCYVHCLGVNPLDYVRRWNDVK
jgi:hypothetical protein